MNYNEMSNKEINGLVSVAVGIPKGDDFCCSWEMAGVIIQNFGISINHFNGQWEADMDYEAPVGAYGTDETVTMSVSDANPLRAAMIVFLMVKDASGD